MHKKLLWGLLLVLLVLISLFVYLKFTAPTGDEKGLKSLIEGHNNKDADRINIVFFLVDFPSEDEVVEFIQRNLAFETGEIIIHSPESTYSKNGEIIHPPEKFSLALGTFSIEPFKSNKDKFNLWYVLLDPDIDFEIIQTQNLKSYYPVQDLKYLQPVLVYAEDRDNYSVPRQHTGLAYLGIKGDDKDYSVKKSEFVFQTVFDAVGIDNEGKVVSTSSGEPGLVWAHEFGHSIFSLRDEYSEPGRTIPSYGYPNCAHDTSEAEQWWGSLIGEVDEGYYEMIQMFEDFIGKYSEEGVLVEVPVYDNCNEEVLRIGYVQGGCYGDGNADVIRPNEVSLMGSGSGNCPVFGSANREKIETVLNLFSGK